MQYALKVLITALLVVAVSELGKRSALVAGIVASLPLVSVLAMIWLYADTGSVEQVSRLSRSIFWLVLPSLCFFLVLPWLLARGLGFAASLTIAIGLTASAYALTVQALARVGIQLE